MVRPIRAQEIEIPISPSEIRASTFEDNKSDHLTCQRNKVASKGLMFP